MKLLLDTILFLAWITVYLAVVFWIGHYRKARAHALGSTGRSDYRADKDMGLWLTVFVVGVLLFFVVYFVTRVLGHFL